ncbi:hypothetical protein SAMN05428967_2220 [Phyllobacterium sp. YR620]|uniref:hypothetical protein n=1 Tax=Phyllobacterium sp. YR620 TaxID=1881066 RepID=UPI00087FF69D|nr:hypothetical protein [Phyllobacterium sp. YR620]SDP46035.1 hypothetical protein SAMN05428967_2220 [Phyllobacterium sp. YR620]
MTDLTPPEHEHSDIVDEAARWYATTPRDFNTPGVVLLRERFGLTALQACEALKMANLIKARSL